MATVKIDPNEIPRKHNPGISPGSKKTPRIDDIRAFLKSGDPAHEVIVQEGEKPDYVYVSLNNAVRSIGAERLVSVTRRFERIFLVRRFAPFSNQAQFKG